MINCPICGHKMITDKTLSKCETCHLLVTHKPIKPQQSDKPREPQQSETSYFGIPVKSPPLLTLEQLPKTPMTEASKEYIRHCVPTLHDLMKETIEIEVTKSRPLPLIALYDV